jgi:hypothetical protein
MATSKFQLNQIKDGTAGELITWSVGGSPVTIGTGTAAHVLTSNGPGAVPSFQAAPSADGNGIYTGSGTVPSGAVASLTNYLQLGNSFKFENTRLDIQANSSIRNVASAFSIFNSSGATFSLSSANNTTSGLRILNDSNNAPVAFNEGSVNTITTGTKEGVSIAGNFQPTSGTGQYITLVVDPFISQTGGSSGTTRGVYINPDLNSATDWRSLEIANTSGRAIYQTGAGATNSLAGVTTLTNTLNIGGGVSTSELRFLEASGNGTNYTALKAPNALTGNLVYTLPSTAPTNGQVLTWNTGDLLSWTSSAGAADGDYGDIVVSGTGSVWSIDTAVVTNTALASGVGGIYKGSGTIPAGTVSTLENSGIWNVKYNSGSTAFFILDGNGPVLTSPTGVSIIQLQDNYIELDGGTARLRLDATNLYLLQDGGPLHFGGGATASEFRFLEPSGSGTNYTGFKAPALASNLIYTLPTAATDGYFLKYNSAGNQLEWAASGADGNGIYTGSGTIATNAVATVSTSFKIDNNGATEVYIGDVNTDLYGVQLLVAAGGASLGSPTYGFVANHEDLHSDIIGGASTFEIGNSASRLVSPYFSLEGINSSSVNELRFYEKSSSGTNYIAFKAQDMSASYTYTLPVDYGTAGYQLTTDGAGALTWATAGGNGIYGGSGTIAAAAVSTLTAAST